MNVLVLGRGRMGRAVQQLAAERGHTVLGPLGRHEGEGLELWSNAEVAVDFTDAKAIHTNVTRALAARVPIVVGTTGWWDDLDRIRDQVIAAGGTLLWGGNFSIGHHILAAVTRTAAALARGFRDYDPSIFEHHHTGKRDAPSGTALELADVILDELPRKTEVVTDLGDGPIADEGLHVTSLRAGNEPGTHRVRLDGPFDSVTLEHAVRDRRVFAAGALFAAERARELTGVIHFGTLVSEAMDREG